MVKRPKKEVAFAHDGLAWWKIARARALFNADQAAVKLCEQWIKRYEAWLKELTA